MALLLLLLPGRHTLACSTASPTAITDVDQLGGQLHASTILALELLDFNLEGAALHPFLTQQRLGHVQLFLGLRKGREGRREDELTSKKEDQLQRIETYTTPF